MIVLNTGAFGVLKTNTMVLFTDFTELSAFPSLLVLFDNGGFFRPAAIEVMLFDQVSVMPSESDLFSAV